MTSSLKPSKQKQIQSIQKKNVGADDEYPEFFDVFLPKYNSQRMRIPNDFAKYLGGRVLKKAILKSRKGKLWHVTVCNIKGEGMYFENGWERFTKENSLQVGYFITFLFDGNYTFNFKIYKRNRCEMFETYEEESDSVEEEEEEDDTDVEDEKEEEKVNKRSGKKRKCLSCCSRTKRIIINIEHCGIEAETYVQPDNPCFVHKLGGNRKNELLIPSSIIHDHSLKLEEKQRITIRRCCKRLPKHEVEAHHLHQEERQEKREWEGKVIRSKDGRFCIREWAKFCGGNRITNKDVCLCEFLVRGNGQTDTLQVHIVRDES